MSQNETRELPLPLEEGVLLAHALAQQVARDGGIRVLFIKGPVANAHELRRHHVPGDVDALVDPERFEEYVRALEAIGWRRRPESLAHKSFVTHSISLMHSGWPCDIDVHIEYPGFFGDRSAVFDILWRRRVSMEIAGAQIECADYESSTFVSALHSLRSPYLERNIAELEQLVEAVSPRLDDDPMTTRASYLDFAEELGSVESLAPFLVRLGIDVTMPAVPSHAFAMWQIRARQLNRAGSWLVAIADADFAGRVRLVWRAVFPTRQDILLDHPEAAGSRRSIASARFSRLRGGARALPRAIGDFLAERRAARDARSATPAAVIAVAGEPVGASDSVGVVEGGATAAPTVAERLARTIVVDDAATAFARESAFAEVDRGDSVYLLALRDLSASRPLRLEGSAVDLWRILEEPASVRDVAELVAAEFGVDRSAVQVDIERFFVDLTSRGLLNAA